MYSLYVSSRRKSSHKTWWGIMRTFYVLHLPCSPVCSTWTNCPMKRVSVNKQRELVWHGWWSQSNVPYEKLKLRYINKESTNRQTDRQTEVHVTLGSLSYWKRERGRVAVSGYALCVLEDGRLHPASGSAWGMVFFFGDKVFSPVCFTWTNCTKKSVSVTPLMRPIKCAI